MKRSSKKGFTLAELLIVIAIIAVLIAIMFPVFGAQIDKANAAAELANVRAKYSELVADAMLGGDNLVTTPGTVKVEYDALAGAIRDKDNTKIIVQDSAPANVPTTGDNPTEDKTGTAEQPLYIVVTYKGKYMGYFEIDTDVTIGKHVTTP